MLSLLFIHHCWLYFSWLLFYVTNTLAPTFSGWCEASTSFALTALHWLLFIAFLKSFLCSRCWFYIAIATDFYDFYVFSVFYSQVFFTLHSFPIFGAWTTSTYFYQDFPESWQIFLEVRRACYYGSNHKPCHLFVWITQCSTDI